MHHLDMNLWYNPLTLVNSVTSTILDFLKYQKGIYCLEITLFYLIDTWSSNPTVVFLILLFLFQSEHT